MASIVVDGYTIIATVNRSYGTIFYEVKNPDGSMLFTASSSAGVSNGLNNLINKAKDAGNTDLANQLSNLRSNLVTALPGLDQQAIQEVAAPATSAGSDAKAQQPNNPATPAPTVQTATGQVTTPPDTTTPTNADAIPTAETASGTTAGTNPPVKTLSQTQSINTDSNNGTPPTYAPTEVPTQNNPTPAPAVAGSPTTTESESPPSATINAGAPNSSEDSGVKNTTTTQANTNAASTATLKITPQPNVLDQYASYSYVASLYLCTEDQYKQLLYSKSKRIDGYNLLMQSGGAPANNGGVRTPPTSTGSATYFENDGASSTSAAPVPPDGGRNPFFDNDFYIDSITIENIPQGKGSGAAHNSGSIKFTVVEPLGMTLLDRLRDAVANLSPPDGTGKVNYTAATFLMVIRFYGYDQEGNLVMPIKGGLVSPEATSDPKAVVEKFIPFRIKGINWSIGSKLVSYEWEGAPVGLMMGGYTARGTVPYDVQLVDTTVKGLLSGDVVYADKSASAANPGASTASSAGAGRGAANDPRRTDASTTQAPAKADAAPSSSKTITRGLMGAMNAFQDKLVADGIYEQADRYYINFLGGFGIPASKIENAKLQLPNEKVDKAKVASGQPSSTDAQGLDMAKISVSNVTRSFSITAGQQILQAIELVLRNSSYISEQQLVIIDPDGTQRPNPNARQDPPKWFSIKMDAKKRSDKIDQKRNDYAYDITFTVTPFITQTMNSIYFAPSKFAGVHKSYPYWFTGQNTAILEYQESLNSLFQLTLSGSSPKDSQAEKLRQAYTSSMADIITYNYAPRSTESSQGADGKSFEAAANAAEVLYSPGDLRDAKIKIIGDPAWIMQGSMFRPVTASSFGGTTGFEADGSISFDSSDILFEINWQRPEDYDLGTGLADPFSQTQKKYNNRLALQSRVYYAKKVTSEFKQGRFEQTIEGALYVFPKPNKSNTANAAALQTDDSQRQPNKTAETAARTGVNLTTDAAAAARSAFAKRDPRLVGAISGLAGVSGAQPTATAVIGAIQAAVPASSVPGPNNSVAGQGAITGTESTAGTNTQISIAGPSKPASDGFGQVVGVATSVSPERLLEAPAGQTGLTAEQQAQIAQSIQASTAANRLATIKQTAAGTSPVSTTNPSQQKIVRDF